MAALSTSKRVARVFAAGTALSIIFSGAAMAADANAVAERVKALYAKQGGELSFTNVKADGVDIILEGTKVKVAKFSETELSIGDVTLQGVQDTADGGYIISQVAVPDIELSSENEKNDKASVKGLSFENITLPSEKNKSPLDNIVLYDKMAIKEIDITNPGIDKMSVKDFVVTIDSANKPEKLAYTWTVGDIDAKFKKGAENPLAALNMDSFKGQISSKGSWLPKAGDLALEQLEIQGADIGIIDITANIGGYDLAFIDAVQQTKDSMDATNSNQDAAGLALLGLAEQLSLKDISIRFDDDSLTDKLFEYYAKQQGSEASQLRAQIQMMVPLLATQLNNPEFAQQIKAASDKFFTDPKSLIVSARPDQAASFASIFATVSLDPTKLIQLLNINIEANN